MPIPLLIFSDSASASSGLARITRDLATRIAAHLPEFKVGTIGYGASGSTKLPWQQYHWAYNDQWIIHDLPEVWEDFAGNEKGIFLSIQDASRMLWFANPNWCSDKRVADFLRHAPFKKWGYFPIDANGPNGRLSTILGEVMLGYDRVLAYTKWAEKIIVNTIGVGASQDRQLTNLPHGIDTSIFYPRDREECRKMFGWLTVGKDIPIQPDETLVGIVATNQVRKDFGQAIQVFAELAKRRKSRLWIHIDELDRHWSIPYLLKDFGVQGAVITLQNFNDDVMAQLYSACDVTLGIGLGEGYGYPLFESVASGCPVVHGKYGGAVEFLQRESLVPVLYYRTEGVYGCQRPVFQNTDWLHMIEKAITRENTELRDELDWENLWPRWAEWFKAGVSSETVEESCQQV